MTNACKRSALPLLLIVAALAIALALLAGEPGVTRADGPPDDPAATSAG